MIANLPIDNILSALKRALAAADALVLQAPPGAGKTTRVPLALLEEPWLAGKSIVMLEPRRLAAGNAARFMAAQLGEGVGETVGYAVRFERRISRKTRIEVVTEGILTRRLQTDPALEGVGLIIFDEFHERNLHSDLALALCRDAQQGLRPDLKLLVMSATLDAAPVARLLGNAPLLASEGRRYPVEIRYLTLDPDGPAAEFTAAAVQRALRETEGDVLVFLPGAGEIRRCQHLLAPVAAAGLILLQPLYGDLPYAEQERAILPGPRRKVVLATNIAETSLTIEGVRIVVDSGLMRQSRFNVGAGISRLETTRVSKASADQRAGRAGRLGPGICYRLWSEGLHGSLLPFTPPEIRSADLTPLALELANWGVADAATLAWLDPPPTGALAGARQLLQVLGALDAPGRITELGKAMASLPVHPRLARLLVAARQSEDASLGCDVAALLSERDIFRLARPAHPADSDLIDRLEALNAWRHRGRAPAEVEASACAAVHRVARHLRKFVGAGTAETKETPMAARLARLLAPAFADRLAQEREPGSGRYLLAGGQGGKLSSRTAVRGRKWLLALEIEGGKLAEGLIHRASAIPAEVLEEITADIPWRREAGWEGERATAREVRRLGELVLASRPVAATAEEVAGMLLQLLRREGVELLHWHPVARQFAARVRFLAAALPGEEWPDFSFSHLLADAENWLPPFLGTARSRLDLTRLDPLPALQARLGWDRQRRLDQLAPTHLSVPSGSRIPLDYAQEGPPVLPVKLQELFGLAETPRLAGGRVAVLLHLLSPARRPIQVTSDLQSFWNDIYPEVKKELKGRYPKHPWPDDPWSAVPTARVKKRR